MEWNREKILYFIEKYREEPVLWYSGHPEHYNKLRKEDAWERLALLLESEKEVCKKKIVSLLASMRREKQKITQSTGTGKGAEEVYHTTWFAYKAMLFLEDRNKPRVTTDTLREGASEQSETDGPANKNDTDGPPPANKNDTDCPQPSKERQYDCLPPPKKKKKAVALNPEEIITSTFNLLKKTTEKKESTLQTPHRPDECEAYGNYVENKLRSYSKSTRIYVQHYISNLLFSADRGEYDYVGNNTNNFSQRYSTRTTSSRAPSTTSQQSTEAPAYIASNVRESPASYTSDQTDCVSPALSEQFLSEFGDLI